MRNLFFALVLANVLFAAWTAWYGDREQARVTPSETGLPIRLVGEADASPTPDVAGRLASDPLDRPAAIEEPGAGAVPAEATALAATAQTPPSPATPAPPRSIGEQGAAARSAAEVAAGPPDQRDAAASSAAPAATGQASARTAPAADARCVSIGPFADVAAADAADAALESAGYVAERRSADGEIWVGFWVHIASIPSREEASAMLARLRENGLPDAYLIPGEEDGDIISLGVFNDMTRAGRLDEQVRRIGLVPVVAERSRQAVVHWLDVATPAGRTPDLAALGIRGNRLELIPCPAG